MLDPTSVYRTSQVSSTNRVGQVVLLYQGAIRFAMQHLAFVERREIEEAHKASLRAQDIVLELRNSLDISAGPIAAQLDALYEFVMQRLVAGNMAKDPRPTQEAIAVLRGLLEAWQELAARPATASVGTGAPSMDAALAARRSSAAPVLAGSGASAAGSWRR